MGNTQGATQPVDAHTRALIRHQAFGEVKRVLQESMDMVEMATMLDQLRERETARLVAAASGVSAPREEVQTAPPAKQQQETPVARAGGSGERPWGLCPQVRARVVEGDPRVYGPCFGAPSAQMKEDPRVVVFLEEGGWLGARNLLGWCDPLDEPELLNRFIKLDFANNSEIERFYAEIAPSTYPAWGAEFPYGEHTDRRTLRGEPVWFLRNEAEALGTLMQVSAALQETDWRIRLARLRSVFGPIPEGVREDDVSFFDLEGESALLWGGSRLLDKDVPREGSRKLSARKCYGLARALLTEYVGRRLRGVRREVGVEREGKRASVPFALVPRWRFACLREALYLQLYNSIMDRRVRVCPESHRPFLLTRKRGRPRIYGDKQARWRANKRGTVPKQAART